MANVPVLKAYHFGAFLFLMMAFVPVFGSSTFKMIDLHASSFTVAGESTLLMRCNYDLGEEELYSVTFFKDRKKLYRYLPSDLQPITTFTQDGVDVDVSKSGNNSVYLRNLTLDSSGIYTCLVCTEAPYFVCGRLNKYLKVVVPPSVGPVLTMEKTVYKIGSNVSVLCNSGKSKPAPDLKWFVNNQPVLQANYYMQDTETVVHLDRLESTSSRLSFRLNPDVLQKGKVTVKCVSTVRQFSAEASIEIEPLGTF